MQITDNEIKKAVIFCRVSSKEQEESGYSLPSQEKFLKDYGDKGKFKVVKIFSISESASGKSQRKIFNEMMKYVKNNNVKIIICEKVDRLTRNFKDAVMIDEWVEEDEERQVHLVKDSLILHKNSRSQEKLNWGIRILFAKNHIDNLSEEVKKGLREKFEQGQFPGWAPLGYVNKKIGAEERKTVVPDSKRWHLMKKAFEMYLTENYSVLEIVETLYKKGLTSKTGVKVPYSIMTNTLKNPFYAGIMRWNGQEKVGKHMPMITSEEHRQVLHIMDSHNYHASRRRKYNFLLRGFVFCDICGHRYIGDRHRAGKISDYYHCGARSLQHSNKGQNIEVSELEKQIEEKFKSIELSQELIDLTIKKVKKFYYEKRSEDDRQKRMLLNKKMHVEKERETAEKKLLNGVLTDEDFVRMRLRWGKELNDVQGGFDELENKHEADVDTAREVLMLTKDVYKAYKMVPDYAKRLFLSFFWDKFYAKDGRITKAKPTELVETLVKTQKILLSKGGFIGDFRLRTNWLPR